MLVAPGKHRPLEPSARGVLPFRLGGQLLAGPARPRHPRRCDQVELKGNATAGSVTFTVTKANKRGRNLVGTAVTLTVPAGAKVKAKACTTAGSTALTLRDLHVKVPPAKR
jgi:hypothetical protein